MTEAQIKEILVKLGKEGTILDEKTIRKIIDKTYKSNSKDKLKDELKKRRGKTLDDDDDEDDIPKKLELIQTDKVIPNSAEERDRELKKLRDTMEITNLQGFDADPVAIIPANETDYDQEQLIAISRRNFRKYVNRLDIISANGKIKNKR